MNIKALIASKYAEASKLREKEEISDDDLNKIEALLSEAKELEAKLEKLESFNASIDQGVKKTSVISERQTISNPTARVEVAEPNYKNDPKKGFNSPREFFLKVMEATKTGKTDERLRYLATAGSDEQQTLNDSLGGFLVPTSFSPDMLSLDSEGDVMGSMTTKIPMQSPRVDIPARVDKNHSSSVSGGFQVYRGAETQSITTSKQSYELVSLSANYLTGACFATEALLQDSPLSVASLIQSGFESEFSSTIVNERINGTGVGQMEGILNSPALVSVAKETSQTADTINGTNIVKMRKRSWGYQNAVWLANPDTYDNLVNAHVAGTNSDIFLFNPSRGIDVPDTLLGRPIYFTEYASTIGDLGDIMLCNWSQYIEGIYQGMQSAESIHVRFLENEKCWKFSIRNDGKCWWRSALTPKNSSSTLSPFVSLAARA